MRLLLSHPEVDVNRRNNDRLTSFMLAMQSGCGPMGPLGPLGGRRRKAGRGSRRAEAAWPGWGTPSGSSGSSSANAQEKMRRLMDLPATDDLEWTRQDRWVGGDQLDNGVGGFTRGIYI